MSPIRTPLHDLLLKLQDDLGALGYDMLTPTGSTTGPERWTIEIRRHEEPLEVNWAYPDHSMAMEVGLHGVKLTRTQARSLRGYLDSLLGDEEPPPACTCIRVPDMIGGVALLPGDHPCKLHPREGDRFYG